MLLLFYFFFFSFCKNHAIKMGMVAEGTGCVTDWFLLRRQILEMDALLKKKSICL